MCGTSESTGTTVSKLDPLTDRIKRIALGRGLDIMNQSFPGYDYRNRTAGFNPDQKSAFGLIRGFNTPGQGRIIDEGGSLGKISDYMNPYMDQAIAPALRDIRERGQVLRNDIGSTATMANAFGDARHGVVEGQQMEGEMQEVGDLSSQARAAAWNNAMGLRAGDRESQMANAMALLGVGQTQQQNQQQNLNARYEEYLRGVEWPFRGLDSILSILSGSPNAQQVTQTQQQPNNWLAQILGSLGGSFL